MTKLWYDFKQNMMDRYYDVIRMAQQKGIIITQENASNLAHMSYRHGWDGEEMKKQVGHVLTNYEKQKYYDNESKRWDYDWDTKVFVGEVGDWMDYGRDRAAKQLIEVDQEEDVISGVAEVYTNVFTDWPDQGGVPVTDEIKASVQLIGVEPTVTEIPEPIVDEFEPIVNATTVTPSVT